MPPGFQLPFEYDSVQYAAGLTVPHRLFCFNPASYAESAALIDHAVWMNEMFEGGCYHPLGK